MKLPPEQIHERAKRAGEAALHRYISANSAIDNGAAIVWVDVPRHHAFAQFAVKALQAHGKEKTVHIIIRDGKTKGEKVSYALAYAKSLYLNGVDGRVGHKDY